jgi:hypothetical protein
VPTGPAVLALARANPAAQYTSAASVAYALTFNEPVTGVAPADFHVTLAGSLQAAPPVSVSGSGANYTVTVNGVHGNGTLRLDLIGNGTITDAAQQALGSQGSFQGQPYTIDQAYTHVVSINRTTPASLSATTGSVSFTVTFSQAVTGIAAGDFQLVLGGTAAATIGQVTPVSGAVYTVTVGNITGNGTVGLKLVNNGQIRDLAGNPLVIANPNVSFTGPAAQATSTGPDSLTAADVNGDGIPDLIDVDYKSNTVNVLLGNGDGTFQPQKTYATGTDPRFVAVADVNGDGKPDLVVANSGSHSVGVLLGNGDGTFQNQVSYDLGDNPTSVAVADLTGNGIPDLVVTSTQTMFGLGVSGSLSVLLGNGDGTFKKAGSYPVPGNEGIGSVTVADLNGDGKPDVVLRGNDEVTVLLGNGDGTFQNPQNFGTGGLATSVVVADVNGDGIPDLIVPNFIPGVITDGRAKNFGVLLGKGDGTFQNPVTYPVNLADQGGVGTVAVADFTGTGKPGLVYAIGPPGELDVYANSGGQFVGQATGQAYTVGSLTDRYVAQLYEDLLQRPPDAAGLAVGSGGLDASGATPQQLAASFVGSSEFRTLEVNNAYETILARSADAAGLSYWVNFLGSGHSLAQLEAVF